jgi:hypothetical protein
MKRRFVYVNNKMQKGYKYELVEPIGKNFAFDFKPELTPKEMLKLGIFGGNYITDCKEEYPDDWFKNVKLFTGDFWGHDKNLNYFKIDASQPLSVWKAKGWINEEHDPRGWFEWYCRYYMGRRLENEDRRQIDRWKKMVRHIGQIKKNCRQGDINCRPRQRQALLHWAYDSRKI